MFFFQDLLLSGFYCAGLSSKDLPWLIIVDDKNVNNDMYDVFSGEFRRIWEISSSNHEQQIESEEKINQDGYFISYSSQDREVADHIESLLWRQNCLVIRDEQNFEPGHRISDEIRQQIANCQTFLVLCSQNHNRSLYCQGEIDIAFEQQKRIIVISLDGSKPQDTRLSNNIRLKGDTRENRDLAIRMII
ncbi:MAG: toll/interleukin-1 receptor domain-containing protein [Snowella sp.]